MPSEFRSWQPLDRSDCLFAAFLTPIVYPVNLLMMGYSRYMPHDFIKVELGMPIVTFVTILLGIRVFLQV